MIKDAIRPLQELFLYICFCSWCSIWGGKHG